MVKKPPDFHEAPPWPDGAPGSLLGPHTKPMGSPQKPMAFNGCYMGNRSPFELSQSVGVSNFIVINLETVTLFLETALYRMGKYGKIWGKSGTILLANHKDPSNLWNIYFANFKPKQPRKVLTCWSDVTRAYKNQLYIYIYIHSLCITPSYHVV